MIVATTGAVPALVAVNAAIFPEPLAASPIEAVLFVQLYTIDPPLVGLPNVTSVVEVLLQTTWLVTAFTVAVGFTIIVNVLGVPVQVVPAFVYDGVTVMVAVTGALPAFVAVNELISPAPLAASPIEGVLFVQLYTIVPPVVGLPNDTAVVAAPLHITWFVILFTVAVGLTVIVNDVAEPLHVVAPFV